MQNTHFFVVNLQSKKTRTNIQEDIYKQHCKTCWNSRWGNLKANVYKNKQTLLNSVRYHNIYEIK